MRDLNYQLKQLCRRNQDGSYATQAKRMNHIRLKSTWTKDGKERDVPVRTHDQRAVLNQAQDGEGDISHAATVRQLCQKCQRSQ